MELGNLQISPEDSRKRAITVKIDRWTFTLIGFDTGLAIALTHYLMPSIFVGSLLNTTVLSFVASSIIVGGIALIGHLRFDNALESFSKDYLSFTYTLGLILAFVLPGTGKMIGLIIILIVSFLQVLIVINASIEFIRFEELNPLWYLAEETFVAIGLIVGIALPWSCNMFADDTVWFLYIGCLATLVNIFAQSFINQGSFPSADSIHIEDNEDKVIDKGSQLEPPDVHTIRGKKWNRCVKKICEENNLSPRQSEILELLANGRDVVYIENYFCISKSTAKTHIYNIYKKLSIHSRQELIDIVERMEQ